MRSDFSYKQESLMLTQAPIVVLFDGISPRHFTVVDPSPYYCCMVRWYRILLQPFSYVRYCLLFLLCMMAWQDDYDVLVYNMTVSLSLLLT